MNRHRSRLPFRPAPFCVLLAVASLWGTASPWQAAFAQTPQQNPAGSTSAGSGTDPKVTPAPSTPETRTAPSATPPAPAAPKSQPAAPPTTAPGADKPAVTPPAATLAPKTPEPKTPEPKTTDPDGVENKPLAPEGKPGTTEIEPHGSPGIPEDATTENVDVPVRPVVMAMGQSSYDDAFKSIKSTLDNVKKGMDNASLKPTGHPITIFKEPDDKGFKYQAGWPIGTKPEKTDLGGGVTVGQSPSGKAIKFQHRGAYEDIDSTYDVITAYLDAKGLQVDSPYIEEYLTDLTTADDPNLQVDIYVFIK